MEENSIELSPVSLNVIHENELENAQSHGKFSFSPDYGVEEASFSSCSFSMPSIFHFTRLAPFLIIHYVDSNFFSYLSFRLVYNLLHEGTMILEDIQHNCRRVVSIPLRVLRLNIFLKK